MRFKAIEIANKPYIFWQSTNDTGSLIMEKKNIPSNVYGVCPLKIVEGELVERTELEMDTFQTEFEQELAIQNQRKKTLELENEFFNYGGLQFPMNETARLYYQWLSLKQTATEDVLHTKGIYKLDAVNRNSFLDAYYSKLYQIVCPT